MDELMRQHPVYSHQSCLNKQRDLTCSIICKNTKFSAIAPGSSESSIEEYKSMTRIVSQPEDLDSELKSPTRIDIGAVADNRSLLEFGHNLEEVENWLTVRQPKKEKLISVMRFVIETHQKTTVQVSIKKMIFNCHFAVLQIYSTFFKELTSMPLVVVLSEEKVSPKAFMLIYKWMLSDEIQIERKDIVPIFVAATYLRMKALIAHCWKFFDSEACFNEDSACILYIETQMNPALDVVRNLMLTRIRKFFLTFVATSDFLNLPFKHLEYLLSSSNICVNTEIEILFAAARWVNHEPNVRSAYFGPLLKCIRFHLMPLCYLLYVRRFETHPMVKGILSLADVGVIFSEAISTVTFTMYEGKLIHTGRPTGGFGSKDDRKWICDMVCPYHHALSCPWARAIQYYQFEEYLKLLQQKPHDHWQNVPFLKHGEQPKCFHKDLDGSVSSKLSVE